MCTSANPPCILGSGGGLAIRVGYRSPSPWYLGGAYEFARHDSTNILRLAILQQFRVELRRYIDLRTRITPYVIADAGGVLYGSDWSASTGGGVIGLGAGAEFQMHPAAAVGIAAMYRRIALRNWTDGTNQLRADGPFGFGFAHLVSIQFILELRDQLPRW